MTSHGNFMRPIPIAMPAIIRTCAHGYNYHAIEALMSCKHLRNRAGIIEVEKLGYIPSHVRIFR